MSTSDKYTNITSKKLMGYLDFDTKFLQYLRELIRESLERVWDSSAVHDVALVMSSDGAGAFRITGTSIASDGQGRLLRVSDAQVNDGINFENSNGIDYYVALKYCHIPNEIDINPRTGLPEYREWIEEIGEENTPDDVIDNGDDTITFQVDSITESGVSNAGRSVLVYKIIADKNATTVAIAIEICTVAWTGTQNVITTTNTLGQTTISEVAADYVVVLLGPTVKRYIDLRTVDGYVYIGCITGNGGTPTIFDHTDQQLASVSLSQIAQIAAKATNDRLKVNVVPLSNEEGIAQISSKNIYGGNAFSVDELGQIIITAVPSLDVTTFPRSPTVSIPKTTFTSTYATTARCINTHTINGKKKVSIINGATQYAELWDVETMIMESSAALTSMLPGASYVCYSSVGDGQYLYGWFYNGTTGLYIQSFDVSDWSVKTGWGAIGISMNTQTTGPNVEYLGKMIVNLDSDRIAIGRWIDGQQICFLSKADGSILSTGDGDAPSTDFEPRAICTDGQYVYALFIEGTPSDPSYVVSCSVDNINVGCGGTGWPKSVAVASDTYKSWITVLHDRIIVPNNTDTGFWVYGKEGNDFLITPPTNIPQIDMATSDGLNVWLKGTCKLIVGAQKTAIHKFHVESMISSTVGATIKTLTGNLERFFTTYILDDHLSDDGGLTGDRLTCCGNDIWYLYSPGGTTPGKVRRIPNVTWANNGGALGKVRTSLQQNPVTNVLTIDCSLSDFFNVSVGANITTFNITNYSESLQIIVRLQAQGAYTVTGFPAGSLWLASPRPPFTTASSSHYILYLTILANTHIMCEWTGPFTSI